MWVGLLDQRICIFYILKYIFSQKGYVKSQPHQGYVIEPFSQCPLHCSIWYYSYFYLCKVYFLSFLFSFWLHPTSCGMLAPWPGIKPGTPAVEAQGPNHLTSRELPISFLIGTSFIISEADYFRFFGSPLSFMFIANLSMEV